MKFTEIPKLMKDGPYKVDMPLGYFIKWLKEEQENGLILNPDFQRGHVWTEAQQVAYVEFILRGGKSAKTVYFNCPNYRTGARPENFVCVDGLQRITAIQRFMNNEITAFGVYYKDYEDKLPLDIDITININELEKREDVLRWYIEMNEGGTPHTRDEIDRVKSLLEKECYVKKHNRETVGKIEWLAPNGKPYESRSYTSVCTFIKDVLEEDRYGVPITVVIHMTENATLPEGVTKIFDDISSCQTIFKVILNPLYEEEMDTAYKKYEIMIKTFDGKTEYHTLYLNAAQYAKLCKVMDKSEYACYSLLDTEGKEFTYEEVLIIGEKG